MTDEADVTKRPAWNAGDVAVLGIRGWQGGTRVWRINRDHCVVAASSFVVVLVWVVLLSVLGQHDKASQEGSSAFMSLVGRIDSPKLVHRDGKVELSAMVTGASTDGRGKVLVWGVSEWRHPELGFKRVGSAPGMAWDAKGEINGGSSGIKIASDTPSLTKMHFAAPHASWRLTAVRVGLSREDGRASRELARIVPEGKP